jgi:hypothetical protein
MDRLALPDSLDPEGFATIVDQLCQMRFRSEYDGGVRDVDQSQNVRNIPIQNPPGWSQCSSDKCIHILCHACGKCGLPRMAGTLDACKERFPEVQYKAAFAGRCLEAGRWNRPGLQLYLFQKLQLALDVNIAMQSCSTALLQVFMDHGWDPNGPHDQGFYDSPLGYVLRDEHGICASRAEANIRRIFSNDEHLTRWLLQHGGDLNRLSPRGITNFPTQPCMEPSPPSSCCSTMVLKSAAGCYYTTPLVGRMNSWLWHSSIGCYGSSCR